MSLRAGGQASRCGIPPHPSDAGDSGAAHLRPPGLLVGPRAAGIAAQATCLAVTTRLGGLQPHQGVLELLDLEGDGVGGQAGAPSMTVLPLRGQGSSQSPGPHDTTLALSPDTWFCLSREMGPTGGKIISLYFFETGSHCAPQAGLELLNSGEPSASASQVLGLQACATTPGGLATQLQMSHFTPELRTRTYSPPFMPGHPQSNKEDIHTQANREIPGTTGSRL
jgi:hypothetical protein